MASYSHRPSAGVPPPNRAPTATQSNTSSKSKPPEAGPFFLCIEGLPPGHTWKTLKDLIRPQGAHGLWTDVSHTQNGLMGYARLNRYDEALHLYQFLTEGPVEGRALLVHLYDLTTNEARFMACNCNALGIIHTQNYANTQAQEVTRFILDERSFEQATIARTPSMPAYPSAYAPTVPYAAWMAQSAMQAAAQNDMARAFANLQLQQSLQQTQAFANLQLQQQNPVSFAKDPRYLEALGLQAPGYATSSAGLPVNVRDGYVKTEYRGVFVSGLDFKAKATEVKELFIKAGKIEKFDLKMDPAKGTSKGYATMLYRSEADARKAITMFNGQTWRSRTMIVRLDKDATTIDSPAAASSQPAGVSAGPPTIVDSSKSGGSRRDRTR